MKNEKSWTQIGFCFSIIGWAFIAASTAFAKPHAFTAVECRGKAKGQTYELTSTSNVVVQAPEIRKVTSEEEGESPSFPADFFSSEYVGGNHSDGKVPVKMIIVKKSGAKTKKSTDRCYATETSELVQKVYVFDITPEAEQALGLTSNDIIYMRCTYSTHVPVSDTTQAGDCN